VNNFVPDIDGRAEPLERELDDLDRAINAVQKPRGAAIRTRKGGNSFTVQAM